MNSEFNKLWASSAISNIGDGIARAAFPLLAALITRDPALVAGLTVSFTLPWLLFSLHAGALIDRVDRRKMMVIASAVRFGLLTSLSVMIYQNNLHILTLYVIAFLFGITEVIFDNTSTTILPNLVADQDLEKANSRIFAAMVIGNSFVGPSVGGFLFATAAGLPFLIHSGFLAFGTVLILALRGNFLPKERQNPDSKLSEDIVEGWRWLKGNQIIFSLSIGAGITNIAGTAAFSIMVLYVLETLHLSEAGYGVLLTIGAVGGLLGTLVAARISKKLGSGRAVLTAMALEGISYIGMVSLPNAVMLGGMIALHAFAIVLWNVNAVSLRQSITPNELLGRVQSTYRLVGEGATPIGAFVGGLLAKQFGLTTPFIVGGITVLVAVFFLAPFINNSAVEDARQEPYTIGEFA